LIDIVIEIHEKDAYATTRRLALEEGVFVGASSGAAMFAAIRYARKIDKGTIVILFPDRGEKYLSTAVFEG
jgi:cysteine synthase